MPGALAASLVLLAALPLLLGGVSGEFIALDDNRYVYENAHVLRGLGAEGVAWALTSLEDANWYPLRRLSHLVDVSLFGLDARWHRWVSVGWHAAAAVLLFAALARTTGTPWRSFLVAALFAAHPIQVESVAWVAERSNVQAGFFLALTLLLYARHLRRPTPGSLALFTAAGGLGLVAKPTLVILPFLLLLLDHWPLGRTAVLPAGGAPGAPARQPWRRLLGEKIPLLVLAAGSGAMAVLAHRQAGALTGLDAIPLASRLGNAAVSLWSYLGKLLWPAGLAVFYPHPGQLPLPRVLAALLLAAAVTALALVQLRRRPWLATGWFWFLVCLAPASGIVQFGAHAMADRFAYLPSIGLFTALCWLAAEALPPRRLPLAALAAAAVLASLVAAGARQAGLWKDSETLFRHTLAVTRENWVIRSNLASVLGAQGRHAEAVVEAGEAVKIRPNFATARVNLASSLASLGRPEEAVAHLREALRLDPANATAAYNLGASLAAHGRHEEAVASYAEALRRLPDYAKAHAMLGNSLAALGRPGEAIGHYREALRLRPEIPEVWLNLGLVLAAEGRAGEAAAALREALRLRPGYPPARSALEKLTGGGHP